MERKRRICCLRQSPNRWLCSRKNVFDLQTLLHLCKWGIFGFFFFFAWRILDILVYYMLHNWIHWDHYKDLCSWCHFLNSKWIKKMALNDWRQQQEDSYWHNVFVIDLNSIDLRNFGILCRCRLANDVNMRWSMMKQLFVCFRGWDLMFIAWANTSINVWISMFRRS